MNASEPVSRTGGTAIRAALVAALLLWAPGMPAQEPMADPSELDEDDEAWERETAAESAVTPRPPSATIEPVPERVPAQATAPAASHADEADDAAPGREPCGRDEMPDAVPAPGPSPLSEDDDIPATLPAPGPSPLSEEDDTPVEEAVPGPSPIDEDDDPPPD